MKKSILYLLMLLINLFFSLFAGCAYAEQTYYSVLDGSNSISLSANPEERTTPTLELRNGIAFVLNENEPFTGKRETYYSNGQKNIEVHYKDGKKNGLTTLRYDNGQKKLEANFKDGEQNGLMTGWNENGQKEYEENYKNDKVNGLSILWNDGQKKFEGNFKDDKQNGISTTFKNGRKDIETNYKDGKKNGLTILWDENGQKKVEMFYENGQKIGEVFYEDGKIIGTNQQ